MICLATRALGDSVRPRRLSGVVVWPLNFTVRRRRRHASSNQPLVPNVTQNDGAHYSTKQPRERAATLGLITAWAWTILAGGGGAMLIIERGPWPLTNGWFALTSGIAACPLTAWLVNRVLGISFSGRARFATAALIWLAGQIARRLPIW